MTPDYQAAWDLYYILADRRHKEGLVFDEVKRIVDAAVAAGAAAYAEEDLDLAERLLPISVEGVFIPIDEVEV